MSNLLPQGIQRAGFLSPSVANDGILHSIALKGGFQEMISLEESINDKTRLMHSIFREI